MGGLHPVIPPGLGEKGRFTPGYTSGFGRKGEMYTPLYLRVWEQRGECTPCYTSGFGRRGENVHPVIPPGLGEGRRVTPCYTSGFGRRSSNEAHTASLPSPVSLLENCSYVSHSHLSVSYERFRRLYGSGTVNLLLGVYSRFTVGEHLLRPLPSSFSPF